MTPLSTLPASRVQRALLARELFGLGVLDEEEVLKQAQYPNWELILKRVQEKQKAAAAAAQEQMMLAAVTGQKVPGPSGAGARPRVNARGTALGFGR